MTPYLYLSAAIIAEVVATTALKSSDGFQRALPTAGALGGYLCSFYLLSLTLRSLPMGVAYAIWSGVGLTLISVSDWIIFRQRMDPAIFCGLALILAGIVVINLLSTELP